MEVSRILPIFAARLRSWRRALDDGGPVNTGLWVRQTHEQLFLTLNPLKIAVLIDKTTALARNKYICEIADQIVFVGVNEKSSFKTFIEQFIGKSIIL